MFPRKLSEDSFLVNRSVRAAFTKHRAVLDESENHVFAAPYETASGYSNRGPRPQCFCVTWTLTPVKGGVLVRTEQSGFRPEDEAGYRGAGFGWPRFLGGLERVLAGLVKASCLARPDF